MATRTDQRARDRRSPRLRERSGRARRRGAPGRDPLGAPAALQTPPATPTVAAPSLDGRPHPSRPSRQVGPAGRVLVVGLVCLAVWGLLAAPALRRSAEASPLGARRTVALAILRPLARLTAILALDRFDARAGAALGRVEDPAPKVPPADPDPSPTGGEGPRGSATAPPGGHPGAGKGPAPSRSPAPVVVPSLDPPTRSDPLEVLVVGDSLAADLGLGLGRVLPERTFETRVDYHVSSGLARPDYLNWMARVAADVERHRPDVVVAMFGANDDQNFVVGDRGLVLGSREWKDVYRSRVARVIEAAEGRPMVWVGMPIMKDRERSEAMRMLNAIFASEVARHPGSVYVDAFGLFSNDEGEYSAYLPSGGGRQDLVRTADGVHLTPTGAERLGERVLTVMRQLWERRAARATPAPRPSPSTVPSREGRTREQGGGPGEPPLRPTPYSTMRAAW